MLYYKLYIDGIFIKCGKCDSYSSVINVLNSDLVGHDFQQLIEKSNDVMVHEEPDYFYTFSVITKKDGGKNEKE